MIGTVFKKPVTDWTEYTKAAEWCSRTQEATIEDKGDFYEVVPITKSEVEELLDAQYELESWFEEYDLMVKKHSRRMALGVDPGFDILEWHKLAEENAKKLSALRKEYNRLCEG